MKRLKLLRILLVVTVVSMLMSVYPRVAHAGAPPHRLDDNRLAAAIAVPAIELLLTALTPIPVALLGFTFTGRVVPHPELFNVYWGDSWDNSPAPFTTSAIDDFTSKLVNSSYFDKASQYGVGSATFKGSHVASACGDPGSAEGAGSILAWITCEVQIPFSGVPLPNTDGNSIYNIWLPHGTLPAEAKPDCSNFAAYHVFSAALTTEFVVVPVIQDYAYTVLPVDCAAGGTMDSLTTLATHEIIEASTDPIFGLGWIDDSTFDFGAIDRIAKEGEAADICSSVGAVPTSPVRLANGILVAPYWSNSDGACVPGTHTVTLNATGLPFSGQVTLSGDAIGNPGLVTLPQTLSVPDGAHISWSFPSPIADADPGIRYVTSDVGSNGDTTITSDMTDTATYSQEDLLTVKTNPGSVQASDATLTPSGWQADGSTVALNTDAIIPSGADRYRFDNWSGGTTSLNTAATVQMNGPQTVSANYFLQHNITFDESGIPAGVPWTVAVDGKVHSGPYSEWFDHSTTHTFSYQTPVSGAQGTRYVLTGTSEASPLTSTSTRTVIGTYKTQQLLTVQTSGLGTNLTHITLNGTTLGTANDTTPMATWLDDGTSLATLNADADVNGANGVQYFFQSFAPAPPATLNAPVTTTAGYKTMSQLISDALASGGITGPAGAKVAAALTQKFAAVQTDMGGQNYTAALGDLTAFINLVQAQCCTPDAGKAIAPATAKTLQLDALLAYHTALCLGSGQLTATQANTDYTYYKNLVTSLGGTVLPPC